MERTVPVLAQAQVQAQDGTSPIPLIILVGIFGLVILAFGFIALILFSQRRVMEATRAQAESRQRLLEAAQTGRLVLWAMGTDGVTLQVGDSVRAVLGVEPRDLTALVSLAVHEDLPRLESLLKDALIAEGSGRFRLRRPDGVLLDTLWQVRNRGGRMEGVIQDVTKETRLQAQLIQSQKLEAVGTLVGGVCHEFGNILMTVESCVDGLVKDESLPKIHQTAACYIQDAAARGSNLIQRMLGFVRKGRGEISYVSPHQLLDDLKTILGPHFKQKHKVYLEVDPFLPAWAMDRGLLLQALLNLCMNARDAMPGGGAIHVRAFEQPGYLALEVEDEGTGIPEDLRIKIFEPFFTTKEAGKGTGLGLAVTQHIVEAHEGSIECEDGHARGALFRIRFPKRGRIHI